MLSATMTIGNELPHMDLVVRDVVGRRVTLSLRCVHRGGSEVAVCHDDHDEEYALDLDSDLPLSIQISGALGFFARLDPEIERTVEALRAVARAEFDTSSAEGGEFVPLPAEDVVVITRHKALVQHMVEIGLIAAGTPVLEHASDSDVRGKHVIGVLPLHLAALARSVTMIPLALRPEHRGQELSLDQVRQLAGSPQRYEVR